MITILMMTMTTEDINHVFQAPAIYWLILPSQRPLWWVLLSSPILQWRSTERLNYSCQVRQSTYNNNRDLYLATWPQGLHQRGLEDTWCGHGNWRESAAMSASQPPLVETGTAEIPALWHQGITCDIGPSPGCKGASMWPDRCDVSPSLGLLGPQMGLLSICAGTSSWGEKWLSQL